MYIMAIVAANVSVMLFGPEVSILNAFAFIGLNLSARDTLHDIWKGSNLTRNMSALILFGALLSALFGAGQVALASFAAFAASESVDTIIYKALGKRPKLLQVNGSNVVSAAVDSLVFPLIAFGTPLLIGIALGQFLAKVAGGFLWSLVLQRIGQKAPR